MHGRMGAHGGGRRLLISCLPQRLSCLIRCAVGAMGCSGLHAAAPSDLKYLRVTPAAESASLCAISMYSGLKSAGSPAIATTLVLGLSRLDDAARWGRNRAGCEVDGAEGRPAKGRVLSMGGRGWLADRFQSTDAGDTPGIK